MNKFLIAGLCIELNMPEAIIPRTFFDFACDNRVTDYTIIFNSCSVADFIKVKERIDSEKALIESDFLDVFSDDSTYFLAYKDDFGLFCTFDTAGIVGNIYYCRELTRAFFSASDNRSPLLENSSASYSRCATLSDSCSVAIRDLFFSYAQTKGRLPIHSSSIIYNDKAYIFSAKSGTGKTTHTNLWKKFYGVQVLDGDVTMLSLEGDIVFAYGLPWHGTSGEFLNARVELGMLIFLEQSVFNRVIEYKPVDAFSEIVARSFAPSYDRKLAEKNLETVLSLLPHIKIVHLDCRPDDEAAQIMKQYIDERL